MYVEFYVPTFVEVCGVEKAAFYAIILIYWYVGSIISPIKARSRSDSVINLARSHRSIISLVVHRYMQFWLHLSSWAYLGTRKEYICVM